MKKYIHIVVLASLLLCSCNRPKTIPDRKLPDIMRDLIIVNAYSSTNVEGLSGDTLDIYTPVLKKYGYTDADLRHTLNKMAMKKSSRLTEIIDSVITNISVENSYYRGRKAIAEKIDSMANAKYTKLVYAMDSVPIVIKSLKAEDVDKYTINIPVEEGSYRLKLNYEIDSIDKRNYYPVRTHFVDTAGRTNRPGNTSLTRGGRKKINTAINDVTAKDTSFVIRLVDYRASYTKPISYTMDSIYVYHTPPVEKSRIMMAKDFLDYNKEYLYAGTKKDSGALHVVPPFRADTSGRSDL